MGFIEIVEMDENGVTNTPFEELSIVQFAELLTALTSGVVIDLTPDSDPNWL